MPDLTPTYVAALVLVIFLAIGIHEYAHAKFADLAGDPTPRLHGRVTWNLTKHFEPVGTLMIIITGLFGFGIGWGKPVPMDPSKMKNPRWDHFAAVIAGPLSNLLQACVFAGIMKFAPGLTQSEFGASFVLLGLMINISLFLFNLIPIGLLDGMWIAGTFMGPKARYAWTKWNLTQGTMIFFGLVLLGQFVPQLNVLSAVLMPLRTSLLRLLT